MSEQTAAGFSGFGKKYKKIVFYGDSITKGTYTQEGDPMPMRIVCPSYSDIVGNALGEIVKNFGMNGLSFSSASSVLPERAFCNSVEKCELGNCIFVAFGTNDYGTDVPLGKPSDKSGETFFGAVDFCLKTIKKRSAESDVFIILPLPRLNENKPNTKGFVLQNYRNAIVIVAERYGVNVINGAELNIKPENAEDKEKIIFDGTHINSLGHAMLADLILQEING